MLENNKIIMKLSKWCLYFAVFVASTMAQGATKIFEIDAKGNPSPLNWKVTRSQEFVNVADSTKARKLDIVYKIEVPNTFDKVDGADQNVAATVSRGLLTVRGLFLSAQINISGKSQNSKTIMVQEIFEQIGVVYDGCSKNFPEFVMSDKKSAPFLFGISCREKKNEPKGVTVTLPNEVSVNRATVFEREGKGEIWHYYEIPDASKEGGILGYIELRYMNREYKYDMVYSVSDLESLTRKIRDLEFQLESCNAQNDAIVAPPKVEKPPETVIGRGFEKFRSYFNLDAGFGMSSLNVKIETDIGPTTKADSQMTVLVKAASRPIWDFVLVNLDLSTTLMMGAGGTDRQDILLGNFELGFQKKFGKYEIIPTLLLAYLDFKHKESSLRIQSMHGGVGLLNAYNFTPRDRIGFHFKSLGMGSKTLKSASGFGFEYKHQLGGSSPWWMGIVFESLTVSTVNESLLKRDIGTSRTMLMLGL